MLAPAAATTTVYAPIVFSRPDLLDHVPGSVGLAWFAVLLLAAPATAALVNRRRPVATTHARSWLVGLPQLPLALGLLWLDVWLDVRSGYLLAGSGEVEMALGLGTIMAAAVGLLLTLLVKAAGRFGADRHRVAPEEPSSRCLPQPDRS